MQVRYGPVVWALFVCRSVTRTFSYPACSGSCSKFQVVVAKKNLPIFNGPLPSVQSFRTDCLSFIRLQDSPRTFWSFFLHQVEAHLRASMLKFPVVIKQNFQLLSRFDIWTGGMNWNHVLGNRTKLVGRQILTAATSLPNFGQISMESSIIWSLNHTQYLLLFVAEFGLCSRRKRDHKHMIDAQKKRQWQSQSWLLRVK